MRFGVLGPLELTAAGGVVTMRAGRQRALLAILLVHANRAVPVDALIEHLWNGRPPATARSAMHLHLSGVRQKLAIAGATPLRTTDAGYLLPVAADELDLLRFHQLAAEGRAALAAGRPDTAADRLGAALALWRGPALTDVPVEVLHRDLVPGWEEARLAALEDRIDSDLACGRHHQLVAGLRTLLAEHPLRERIRGQAMLALYQSGRQSEALACYRDGRRRLVDEVGVEPGPELRRLEQAMLTADPDLDPPIEVRPRPAAPQPQELPPDVFGFTGRQDQLVALDRMLAEPAEGPTAVVISALSGTAGIGKTALAVHWAHRVRHRFPDGALYADLRGYHPGDRPARALDVLEVFLRSLGETGTDIPADLAARAARFRTMVSDRRMLVILDNARTSDQVRDLLPGTPSCVVVVTSRDRLAGLVARNGARRFDLDLLSRAEAMLLLRTLVGRRVDAEPEAAADLLDRCARLPLAVRIAAEVVAARPTMPMSELVTELDRDRLGMLGAADDEHTSLRSVFSWSYRRLPPGAARCFQLLGINPGHDIERYAVAALTGSDVDEASSLLEALVGGHLIHEASPGHYGMHDLLRCYAEELAAQRSEAERRTALTRLFQHQLNTATLATSLVAPWERDHRPWVSEAVTPTPVFADGQQAAAWLDAERTNLVLGAGYAGDHGWPAHLIDMSAVLHRYLDRGGHYREAETLHRRAVAAAEGVDCGALGRALVSLGHIRWRLGGSPEAHGHHHRGLVAAREAGDRVGEGRAQLNLGLVCEHLGRYPDALEHFRQALAISRDTGNRVAECRALDNLGVVYWRLGRATDALDHHERSLAVARDLGDRISQARAQGNLGLALEQLGRLTEALVRQQESLAAYRAIGDRAGEGVCLVNLGTLYFKLGRYPEALEHQRQALAIGRDIGHTQIEAGALNDSGHTLRRMGSVDRAVEHHRDALGIARDRADPLAEAQALDGLGCAYREAGDDGRARQLWAQALAIFTDLDVPEADEVRRKLDPQPARQGE